MQQRIEGPPRSILLVEDSAPLRSLICEVLEDLGHTVLEASDAEHAHEVAERHGPNIGLLLTDLSLPGTSGMALAKSLAARYSHLKVIYMSGHPGALMAGPVAETRGEFLEKPFTHEALAAKVQSSLYNAATL